MQFYNRQIKIHLSKHPIPIPTRCGNANYANSERIKQTCVQTVLIWYEPTYNMYVIWVRNIDKLSQRHKLPMSNLLNNKHFHNTSIICPHRTIFNRRKTEGGEKKGGGGWYFRVFRGIPRRGKPRWSIILSRDDWIALWPLLGDEKKPAVVAKRGTRAEQFAYHCADLCVALSLSPSTKRTLAIQMVIWYESKVARDA